MANKGKYDDGRSRGKYWHLTSEEVKEALVDKVEKVHNEEVPSENEEIEVNIEHPLGGGVRVVAKGKKRK